MGQNLSQFIGDLILQGYILEIRKDIHCDILIRLSYKQWSIARSVSRNNLYSVSCDSDELIFILLKTMYNELWASYQKWLDSEFPSI